MKKLTILSSLLSITAGMFLASCAHDEPVTTSTTTTTHETAVTHPAATSTTTTRQTGY
jgi:hypothetical protein